jgi:hypothetical protein
MRRLLVLFALLVAALVVAPGAAADDTPCMGTLPAGTYDNVVVPPGQSCILGAGVTVLGNVQALEDSRLRIDTSNVRGNVLGDKADIVQVLGATVRENIIIKEGGPAALPALGFATCFPGPPGPNFANPCEAAVNSTTVEEGSIQIEKMEGSVIVILNGLLSLSPIRGNVQVKETVAPPHEAISVRDNTVAQNMQVEDNFVERVLDFPTSAFNGLLVGRNTVGQNLQVYKNRGPGTKLVTLNSVSESLQCFDNELPFVGTGNFAQEAQGQCSAAPLP